MACEDYPCCGHPAGQCEDRPEYHAEYWEDYIERREAAGYDRDDPDFYPEEY